MIDARFNLNKGAFMVVVYFSMEQMLLYWSVDQYNNVQKGKGCQGGRTGLNITSNLHHNLQS